MSGEYVAPGSEADIAEAIRMAGERGRAFEIRGGGTRQGLGRPVDADAVLSTAGLSGVMLYEPGALTLVAAAGTPLAEIEAMLAAENQQLPFEPMDHRPLLGTDGAPTIGGIVAANVSGPRRIQAGACRDSLIGVRFVTGEGVIVKNGGRVMKNVTGHDLVKLSAGAFGTLGLLTEVSFKLLPRPESSATVLIRGLDDAAAIATLSASLGSPYDVTGAAHIPAAATLDGDAPATMIRVEGLEASVRHRSDALKARLLAGMPPNAALEIVEDPAHVSKGWGHVRNVTPLASVSGAVWKLSLRPSRAAGVMAALGRQIEITRHFYDWGGGLVWLATPEAGDAGATQIRAAVTAAGGHATLVRASAGLRRAIPPFQPEASRLAAVSAELRARFDPKSVLNPGRMAPAPSLSALTAS